MKETIAARTATRAIRLILVDDHAILREGLRSVLEREDARFGSVGEAPDQAEVRADRSDLEAAAMTEQDRAPLRIDGWFDPGSTHGSNGECLEIARFVVGKQRVKTRANFGKGRGPRP